MANATSGIAVHDNCKLKFLDLKARRTYRYIVFKIGKETEQVLDPTRSKTEVEEVGEPTKTNAEEEKVVVEQASEPTKKKNEKKDKVIVEKLGEPAASYEDFTASLPHNECRYAVYDFDFVTEESCQKSKIFFIAWSPDTGRVRDKMIYASTKDRFKRELDGIQVELQATDPTEMGLEVLKSRAN